MSKPNHAEAISNLETVIQKQRQTAKDAHADAAKSVAGLHEALKSLGQQADTEFEAGATLNEETLACMQAVKDCADEQKTLEREAEGRLEGARARIQELENDLQATETLKARLEIADQEIEKLNEEVNRRDASISKAKKVKERMDKVEAAYEAQRESVEAGNAAKRRLEEIATELDTAKSELQPERERIAEMEVEVDELKAAEIQLRADLETAQLQQAVNDSNSEEWSEKTTGLEAQVEELQKELTNNGAEIEASHDEVDHFKQQGEKFEAELESLREQAATAEQLERDLETQTTAREEAERHTAVLEDAVEEVSAQTEALRLRAADTDALLREKQEALDAAHASLDEVREVAARVASISTLPKPSSKDSTQSARPTRTNRPSDGRKRMGEILVDAEVISQEQLEEVLEHQEKNAPEGRLGALIIELGMAEESAVAKAIAEQLDIDFIRLDQSAVDREAAHRITGKVADMHRCIPIRTEGDHLLLAMANPLDLIAIEDVERATNLTVRPLVATASDLALCITCVYAKVPQGA